MLPAAHEAAGLLFLGWWNCSVEHGCQQRGGKREQGRADPGRSHSPPLGFPPFGWRCRQSQLLPAVLTGCCPMRSCMSPSLCPLLTGEFPPGQAVHTLGAFRLIFKRSAWRGCWRQSSPSREWTQAGAPRRCSTSWGGIPKTLTRDIAHLGKYFPILCFYFP